MNYSTQYEIIMNRSLFDDNINDIHKFQHQVRIKIKTKTIFKLLLSLEK